MEGKDSDPAMSSAKQDLLEKIVKVYPNLSPKKRRVADLIMKDYKKIFFMTAKEIAQSCGVSEPTIVRFAADLGFSGYADFLDYMKGLLHTELTSVDRLERTQHRFDEGSTLEMYCHNAIRNLENLMSRVSEANVKQAATTLGEARAVYVVGYRASATLAQHFGYLLKKIREDVFIDITLSWELIDALNTANPGTVLFAIAFPRYPRKTIDIIEYAKKCDVTVIGLSDTPLSPIITLADQHLVVDIEGVSFVDPFAHIITFLGALVHEITFVDSEKAMRGLSNFDHGVKVANEFYTEEYSDERLKYRLDGPTVTSLWPQKANVEE
jgi:DNA-binding MurR/RpiR family transcriptional regulator